MTDEMVFDVTAEDFEERVLAASRQVPIVVDFWAEWCGPCRTLGPLLENVVRSYEGRTRLAKVNVDGAREVAARYGVQSIPAVKVFRDGKVVTEFVGALPEGQVRRVIESVIPSPVDELVERADNALEDGLVEQAEEGYREAIEQDPTHTGALLRLGTLMVERGREGEAEGLLGRIEEDAPEYDVARAMLARLAFSRTCVGSDGPAACRERLAEEPEDLDSRYELACCLAAAGDYEGAIQQFLEVLSRDKGYRDGAAQDAVLRIFSLVGSHTDLANEYRRKLAAILY